MGLFNILLLLLFAGGFLYFLSGIMIMLQGIFIILTWCFAKLFPRRLL